MVRPVENLIDVPLDERNMVFMIGEHRVREWVPAEFRDEMPETKTLTEVIFLVHFQAPLNMTVLDYSKWAAAFSEFPIPQQTAPAPPTQVDAANQNLSFLPFGSLLPRLILRSLERSPALQLQQDRFGFSWARVGELGAVEDYPGYDRLKIDFFSILRRFSEWHQKDFGPTVISLVELIYVNSLPLEKAPGENRRLSEVFTFVEPRRRVNGFAANWTEFIELSPKSPRVNVQTGLGAVAKDLTTTPTNALFFNFSGVAELPGVQVGDLAIGEALDRLHARIVDVYETSITSQAR